MSLCSPLPSAAPGPPAARAPGALARLLVHRLIAPALLVLACGGGDAGDASTASTGSAAAPASGAAAASTTAASTSAASTSAASTSAASTSTDAPDLAAQPSLGGGVVVWESSRSGAWRLWVRPLDGGPPRQLSADEPGRAHCCPHVAPDGRRLVYLSLPQGQETYPRAGAQGVLRLVTLERDASGGPRAGAVRDLGQGRTYFEHRAAVWRDARRLIYIDGDGRTRELDLDAGEGGSRVLVAEPSPSHGWLVDPTLRWATRGGPTFSLYDAASRAVVERPSLGGCQPYFTGDGRWGVWIAGAGGPLRALDLESRTEHLLLAKSDPRLPDDATYLYFPMPSRDSMLLAFGASDGAHDHQTADYDIFVVETDPETLDLVGPVRRVTEHPATDRFPDVWAEPLALGRHVAEAPRTVRFAVPEAQRAAGPWRWRFGDGAAQDTGAQDTGAQDSGAQDSGAQDSGAQSSAVDGTAVEGNEVEHAFTAPGRYTVEARASSADAPVLRGSVRLRPGRPPRLLAADVRRDGHEIRLRFDEGVRVDAATARLESGRALADAGLDDGGRTWILRVEGAPVTGPDAVRVDGVADRAEPPHRLDGARIVLEPPRWPSRRDDLVLLWHTGDRTNTIAGRDGVERATLFERRGAAWLDRAYRMTLRGGSYLAEMETMQRLLRGARARNELTLEVTVTPEQARVDGRATIFTFSSGLSRRNFTLAQEGERYTWRLNTPTTGDNADRPVVDLGPARAGTPQHLVVAYSPGHLDAWIDGERTVSSAELQSGFFHWRELPLLTGAEWPDQLHWRGRLEALAVYARALDGDEVTENGRRLAAERARRETPEQLVVRARLTARSAPPSLDAIAPYRDALGVFEYEVVEVESGRWNRPRLRVAHRLLVDGATTPIHAAEPGTVLRLVLEPYTAQPQLEALVVADDLSTAEGVPLWYSDRIAP